MPATSAQDLDDGVVSVPWTNEQVDNLNAFQHAGWVHHYTCGNDAHTDHVDLIATPDGWICPECDYRQGWAHAFSANPLPPLPPSHPRCSYRLPVHSDEVLDLCEFAG